MKAHIKVTFEPNDVDDLGPEFFEMRDSEIKEILIDELLDTSLTFGELVIEIERP